MCLVLTRSDFHNGSQAKDQLVSIVHTASNSCTKTAPERECGWSGGGVSEGRDVGAEDKAPLLYI